MDAEAMRRRAGELADRVARSVCSAQEAAEAATILRAVAAGYIVTDTPDGLVPAEYMREGRPVLVVSPDGVGVG